MRILQINETSALGGGADQHFHDLCSLLTKEGQQVQTFCPGDITLQTGRDVISRPLEEVLREFRPDIVHVHGLRQKHLWLLEFLGEGLPLVQTWHDHAGFCLNQSLYNAKGYCERCRGGHSFQAGLQGCVNVPLSIATWWRRQVLGQDPYRRVQRIIVPSFYLRDKALEWGVRQKIQPIYNFTRHPVQTALPEREQGTIVFSGRLSALKGVRVLLEAINFMDCRLIILGDGELREEVAQAVAASKPGKILWPGFCTGEEYWEQLGKASVLVLPSLCPETFGLSICDAFSLGIPAVGTDLGGARELIGPGGERGLLVPPGDAAALRQALVTMLTQKRETTRAQGEAGRCFVEENLGWDRYYPALMECYREAVDERD